MLEENARIENPGALWKSGVVFLLVIVGFIVGERFHIVPAVPALIGATALALLEHPEPVLQMLAKRALVPREHFPHLMPGVDPWI